jgi:hypothetical protein
LVGVTLEVDQATLHKPEYCRILLGCRDVDAIPPVAEGVLGDYFYDFAYEVETVVVRGPPADRSGLPVSSAPVPPSPKRPRIEHSLTETSAASSEGQSAPGSFSGTGNYGKSCNQQLPTVSEHESEEESEPESGLLIDQIVQENLIDTADNASMDEGESTQSPVLEGSGVGKIMVVYEHGGSSGFAPFTPVVEKEMISPDVVTKKNLSYAAVVSGTLGPVIVELADNHPSPMESASYFVQSPVDGGTGKKLGIIVLLEVMSAVAVRRITTRRLLWSKLRLWLRRRIWKVMSLTTLLVIPLMCCPTLKLCFGLL